MLRDRNLIPLSRQHQHALALCVRLDRDLKSGARTPEQQATLVNHVRSLDQELARLQRAVAEYPAPPSPRVLGAQDLTWALLNSPAFLFNH